MEGGAGTPAWPAQLMSLMAITQSAQASGGNG
jgi:hypothetical protein